jgi:hypothetical protein
MTNAAVFFLNISRLTGNIVSRKGPLMSLAQRALAGVFATAMAVAPSLAQDAKVTTVSATDPKITHQADKPYLFEQVASYSETHPVVVIGVSKGQKETLLTGEQIGDKLADVLKKVHHVPSKYFVEKGGDYTAIIFAVDGHLYGPYGLKESLAGMVLAVNNYDEKVRKGIFPPPDATSNAAPGAAAVAAKHEPN